MANISKFVISDICCQIHQNIHNQNPMSGPRRLPNKVKCVVQCLQQVFHKTWPIFQNLSLVTFVVKEIKIDIINILCLDHVELQSISRLAFMTI